jgi:hypothetical protein
MGFKKLYNEHFPGIMGNLLWKHLSKLAWKKPNRLVGKSMMVIKTVVGIETFKKLLQIV